MFSVSTISFFENITINNSKHYFEEHKTEYELFVKTPLIELYYDLLNTINDIDNEIELKLQRCISTPYTDSRFMRKTPIKEYMYLRFKLSRNRKTDIPGFFFDASIETIRFGLKIYNTTAIGMEKIRLGLLNDVSYSNKCIKKLEKNGLKIIDCEKFKKDHYPEIREPLKSWLNSRDIKIYWLLSDYSTFFRPELKDEISHTFRQLAPIYNLLKC
jgi:uncharacterized protein (DUF2461 family)